MLLNKGQRPNKAVTCVVGAFLAFLLLFLFSISTNFTFLTNDDMYLRGIVSGEISGANDAHMIYSHYFLGLVLSKLYSLWNLIPWYGIYLLGSVFLALTVIFYRVFQRAGSYFTGFFLSAASFVLFYSVFYRNIARIQYTYVAALVGGAGVFWLLTLPTHIHKLTRKEIIRESAVSVGLISLCFMIRSQVFFMLIPFAGILWGVKFWFEDKNRKPARKFYISIMGSIACVILFLMTADLLPYGSKEWKEFKIYNKARESLMDYYGFPDFEENKELYQNLGLSKESYELVYGRYMLLLDEDYDAHTLGKLAEKAENTWKAENTFPDRLFEAFHNFIEYNLNYTDRPVNLIVYMLYALVFVAIFLTKEYKKTLFVCALIFTRMMLWGYLFYMGRYPDRVTQGLYVIEFLALFSFLLDFSYCKMSQKKLFSALAGCVVVGGLWLNFSKIEAVKGTNEGAAYSATAYYQLEDYCESQKNNLYILDMESISFYSDSLFSPKKLKAENILPGGSWFQGSPLIADKLKKYHVYKNGEFLLDNQNVYLVIRDSQETSGEYLTDFMRKKYGNENLDIIETLETDIGIVFHILKDERL